VGSDARLLPDPPGHDRRPRLTTDPARDQAIPRRERAARQALAAPSGAAVVTARGGAGPEFGSNSAPMWLECPQPASEQSQNHPHPQPEEHMATGYCLKCKEQREIKGAEAITMKNGKPATTGTCPVCGTKIFKIGKAA